MDKEIVREISHNILANGQNMTPASDHNKLSRILMDNKAANVISLFASSST